MYTIHARFASVKSRAEVSGACEVCGKRCTRKTTIENTVNPFNRNEDGSIRTRAEVQANVLKQAREWEAKQPIVHVKCEDLIKETVELYGKDHSHD